MKQLMTNGYILKENKILLGMKKRGFGIGKWNGFGGKIKTGETVSEAVAREFEEECSIKVLKTIQFGVITFIFITNLDEVEVYFYKILEYEGEPIETNEMKPQWFDINEIPYELMWKSDRYWMPLFLKGKNIKGKIFFNEKDEVVKAEINQHE